MINNRLSLPCITNTIARYSCDSANVFEFLESSIAGLAPGRSTIIHKPPILNIELDSVSDKKQKSLPCFTHWTSISRENSEFVVIQSVV